jgi:hypothetical protein
LFIHGILPPDGIQVKIVCQFEPLPQRRRPRAFPSKSSSLCAPYGPRHRAKPNWKRVDMDLINTAILYKRNSQFSETRDMLNEGMHSSLVIIGFSLRRIKKRQG